MSEWENPVTDLIQMLAHHSTWPLLEILAHIPEEIDSRYLRLGANRRQEVHKQLMASTPKLLEYLCSCLHTTDKSDELIQNCLIHCYNSWIAIHAIAPHIFIESPLTQQVFCILSQPDTMRKLHDTSTDCLCSFLGCIEAACETNSLDVLVSAKIYNGICSLESSYHTSVAKEEVDKTMNYCRIFTVMSETFFYQMVACTEIPHYTIGGLDLLLMCVGHYDYEVSEITFNFWYRLSEELFHQNNDKLTIKFKPHIERLLTALYRHAQMDSDTDGLIDDNEGFGDFRRKVADLIKDVAFIVGSSSCFKQMFVILTAPDTTWEQTESALFVMQNVAKNLVTDENDTVPKVIEAILNMPQNSHIAVRYTSIMLLGELCDWIENHPDTLEAILNFLHYSMQQKNGLASAATTALTLICTASKQKMIIHINGLMLIAKNLDMIDVSNELAIGLLKSFALVLTRLPRQQLETALREMVSFQLQPLALMVEDPNATIASIAKNERTDPTYWIDRACVIIRHTNPDISDNDVHPTKQLITDSWPLISSLLNKYQSDVRIMERACRLLRYSIRMVHKQAAPLVEPLVKQMISLYGLHHHSCFLYLGSVLVDEFARIKECIPGLLEMLQAFIEPTFCMLRVENGLKNNPDTVDDFFRLCSRFIDSCPLPFLQSALVTPIFQCALLACTLDHREANSSVMRFFCNLLKWGRISNFRLAECRPLVKDIAEQNGEALVVNLLHASVFYLHAYMLPEVAEVLYELKGTLCEELLKRFLINALNLLPKKNSGGFITATQEQLDDFTNTVLTADCTKTISVALKAFTRLYR
ncbi:transportin-3 isoform X2 [Teleopsis dalmanni]|nr:transportin-3 isoform X2 [Teleopsis dalmanni]